MLRYHGGHIADTLEEALVSHGTPPWELREGAREAGAWVAEVLPADLGALQAAGVEWLKVFAGGKKHEVPARNQADMLYVSLHGHRDGTIGPRDVEGTGWSVGDIKPERNWRHDLESVVLDCCTVLNFKAYTPNDTCNPGPNWYNEVMRFNSGLLTASPIRTLCGHYDLTGGGKAGHDVVEEFARQLLDHHQPVWRAWMEANKIAGPSVQRYPEYPGNNACVIARRRLKDESKTVETYYWIGLNENRKLVYEDDKHHVDLRAWPDS
jgi:hypothetical protein